MDAEPRWKIKREMRGEGLKSMLFEKKNAGKVYALPIEEIRPSPFQARRSFDPQQLESLAQSIRENGLLQPV